MSPLQTAIYAKATPHQRAAMHAEDWCKPNGWTRICDIPSDQFENAVHPRWEELPDTQQDDWIRNYHDDAEAAWLRYGRPGSYKVRAGYILDDGAFINLFQFRIMDLAGRGFMMVFNLSEK